MGPLLRAQWDRITAWVAAALGAVLLLIGYIKVSGTAYPAEQVPYLVSAGLGALFLLGIAGSLWISADLRDEYAKLDEIARAVAASPVVNAEAAAPAPLRDPAPARAAEPAGASTVRTTRPASRAAGRSAAPARANEAAGGSGG